MEAKKILLSILERIKNRQDNPGDKGICSLLSLQLDHYPSELWDPVEKEFRRLVMAWPEIYIRPNSLGGGASWGYPVGGMIEFYKEENEYRLWKNPRRHELLLWVISELKKEIENAP